MTARHRVVIVGGGLGGLAGAFVLVAAAAEIAWRLDDGDAQPQQIFARQALVASARARDLGE